MSVEDEVHLGNKNFLFSLTLSVHIKWDLYGNYFIDIRLTKYDRGHKRSITQRTERLSSLQEGQSYNTLSVRATFLKQKQEVGMLKTKRRRNNVLLH